MNEKDYKEIKNTEFEFLLKSSTNFPLSFEGVEPSK